MKLIQGPNNSTLQRYVLKREYQAVSFGSFNIKNMKQINLVIKKVESSVKKVYNKSINKFRTKKSILDQDIFLGKIVLEKAEDIRPGVKVVFKDKLGTIKEIKNNDWVVISFGGDGTKEHKSTYLMQYKICHFDRRNRFTRKYRLSYSDYIYVHPKEDNNSWAEVFITKKKYAKLTDEEKASRQHLPLFNKSSVGRRILIKIEEDKLNVKLENNRLITVK